MQNVKGVRKILVKFYKKNEETECNIAERRTSKRLRSNYGAQSNQETGRSMYVNVNPSGVKSP